MNKILLKEYIKAILLNEYKSSFNINYFKSLKDIDQQYDYAFNTLTKLGEGSSRAAFLMPNTKYVLKLARPTERGLPRGLAQNEAELQMFTTPGIRNIVTKIYDYAPDYSWLISESVRDIISPNEFQNITGFAFQTLSNILRDIERNKYRTIKDYIQRNIDFNTKLLKDYEKNKPVDMDHEEEQDYNRSIDNIENEINTLEALSNNKYIEAIEHLLSIGHSTADLSSSDHWGITVNQNLVILDYGATNDVMENFY
jgi:hypothetical protein